MTYIYFVLSPKIYCFLVYLLANNKINIQVFLLYTMQDFISLIVATAHLHIPSVILVTVNQKV